MRHLLRPYLPTVNNLQTKALRLAQYRRQLMCVLLLLVMSYSVFVPVASVYAIEQQQRQQKQRPKGDNPHIQPKNNKDPNKPMKQDYPSGMKLTAASQKAAADAVPLQHKGEGAVMGEALQGIDKKPKIIPHELEHKRTATSSTEVNAEGSIVEKHFMTPKHFQKNGKWEKINTALIEDKNAGDAGNAVGRAWGNIRALISDETTFKTEENDWQARFAPSDSKQGLLRIKKGDSQVGFAPVNAKKVAPVITTRKDGHQVVNYYDLWPGVNVEYIVESAAVKENIIIKDKNAANQVSFQVIGAGLVKQKEKQKVGNQEVSVEAYALKGALNDEFAVAPANLILNNFGFVSDQSVFSQKYENGQITLSVDKDYLNNLPDNAFPAVIDPGVFTSSFGTRAGGNYVSLKSDGYVCPSNVCNPYAGSLYDSNYTLRYWRGAFHAPYDQFRNSSNILTNATLHLTQLTNVGFWTGHYDTHNYQAGHATCLNNFNCLEGGTFNAAATFATVGDMNVTNIYQAMISRGDFGAWLMIGGEDGSTASYKNFDPNNSYVTFTYGGPPSAPSITHPTSNQVYIDTQASFRVNAMPNPNGSTPLQYEFLVSTGAAASGGLVASGRLGATQWTVPDGVLQDGSTYYIQARSYDPITNTSSGWGTSIPFRIDMRTGQDKTQTYDNLGPVNVDLATGNVTTSATSHASAAMGGALGVSLDYNTPLKSRNGLVGEYWSVPAGYPGGTPSSTPNVTRIDQNIDFGWDGGAPASGVNPDWFYARWSGFFVAPKTGTYYFGSRMDDALGIYINDNYVNNQPGTPCFTVICYGTAVSLQEGQVVRFRAEYQEVTGPAYAHVWVKGAVDEQIIPQGWLQTGVRPVAEQRGLVGQYYARQDGTNTFSSSNPMVMQRTDPYLYFDWGGGAPVSNGPADFLVRWKGYVTVPTSGTYNFGSISDDGTKITVGSNNTVVYNDWTPHGPTEGYGTGYFLTANTPTPITIEYFDQGGSASFQFKVEGAVTRQIVPSSWLSPRAQVLPNGWNLGLDADGNLSYDRLKANQNSVILTDSTGSTHEYIWTGSGYKPPVNEDGQLVRNADGTFTLQDVDGRIYVFGQDGTLSSMTNPIDIRNPARLQYEYQQPQGQDGGPVRLWRIKDGVDTSRMATIYYSGDSECGSAPSGFDANAPGGMICAVKTNDGRATNFYYISGQLARIVQPGNSIVDYQYEPVTDASGATVGYRLAGIRDAAANDAIAAGVRTNDDNVKTQIGYDILGRATSVTQPAATTGANRIQHTVEYLPGSKGYVDQNGSQIPAYHGMTKQHIVGAPEPHGFSRRIKYDNLFRTIETTDVTNLTSKAEWDPAKDLLLSAQDATGLRSTTIYDDEDRPTEGYGPAPAAWYGSDRKPLATYAAQVARTDAKYDEGVEGPAVSWYNLKGQTLFGAPKLLTTGFGDPGGSRVFAKDFATNPPITADAQMDGIGLSATGKLRVPQTGTYTFTAYHDDGARLWIDDISVFDRWTRRTETVDGVGGNFTLEAGKVYRLRFEYANVNATGSMSLHLTGPGRTSPTHHWNGYLSPGYSLTTSTKVYDSTLGDSTATVSYGNTPELGLPQSVTSDPTGLNLTSTATYEQQGAVGSFLRQTSKSRPGNPTNNPSSSNTYYGATETRQNPCDTTKTYKQAGRLKKITDASPDGVVQGRTVEQVYDDAGRIVATRTNNDGWVCTSYDSRGRVLQTVIPAFGGEAGRTITNNYAVWGDPLVTGAEDSEGSIYTQVDLLGRTTYYKDAQWNETWSTYDNLGRLTSRTGPLGYETFVYDDYGRLIQQKLDNVTYAIVTYDQYSRTHTVEYPNANGQKVVYGRDALGRVNSQTYYQGGGQTPGINLVTNASAEQADDTDPNKPEGWHTDAWGTNTPSFTYLNEGYTGNRSVKTELTSRSDGDAKWAFDPVNVVGNTAYTFKDYYRSNVTTAAVVEYTHQNQSVSYEWIGDLAPTNNWTQANLSFTTPATAIKATVLHVVSSVGWLIVDDAEIYQSFQSGNPAVLASDTVTRSQSGKILTDVVQSGSNQLWYNYGYDKAGRLTSANIGPHSFSYGYGAQSGSCATGTNSSSGKNSNRTSQTINGVTTTYCYDYADRLTSSSDPLTNAPEYDSHGNITKIGSGTAPLNLGYDSSDRNWGYSQYDSNGNGQGVYYGRDVQGRIVYREVDNISNWNWSMAGESWYGFTGSGGPSIVRNANWDIVEKYLSLPGGVSLTIKPQQTGNNQKQYNLPNMHGDVLLTTNAAGANTSTGNGPGNSFTYDPFGNILPGSTHPNNLQNGSYGYVGAHKKMTETTLALAPIQMGARVYLAVLGRFTQVDPVPGGNANDYTFSPDPVNFPDISGKCILQCTATVGFLQPAATVAYLQPAIKAPVLQPTINSARIQNAPVPRPSARLITPKPSPKPAAPVYNNSTALPAAKPKTFAVHVLDVGALASYGVYYGSYQAAKSTPGIDLSLVAAQVVGLGGDVAINFVKKKMGYQAQLNDHGYVGPILPDSAQNLLGTRGPETYLPGWHYDDESKIDIAW